MTLPAQEVRNGVVRVATFAAPLSRDGPGLLLRDILEGDDPQVAATIEVMARVNADIVVLTAIDWDAGDAALRAMVDALGAAGAAYPYVFSGPGNSGVETGLDLDGDGRPAGPRDAQGYGRFTGQAGLAILSRFPICGIQDLSHLLWVDMPGATLPRRADGTVFPSAEAVAVQRLSSTAHWIVAVLVGEVRLDLLAWSATPPVFDGPEDRNGLRARDELLLWRHVLDGRIGAIGPHFVILGTSNIDPADGDGDRAAMRAFLADPRIHDTRPGSAGGRAAADANHLGDPSLDTADWEDAGPGNLRVSYVLPSADLESLSSGVYWPAPGETEASLTAPDGVGAGPHRMVWVDLRIDQARGQDNVAGCRADIRQKPVEFR